MNTIKQNNEAMNFKNFKFQLRETLKASRFEFVSTSSASVWSRSIVSFFLSFCYFVHISRRVVLNWIEFTFNFFKHTKKKEKSKECAYECIQTYNISEKSGKQCNLIKSHPFSISQWKIIDLLPLHMDWIFFYLIRYI